MKTITNDVYTYFYSIGPSQDEIELTNSILKNLNFSDKKELSEKILKLSFNEQVHVIHYILSEMYKLEPTNSNENKKIEKFLALEVFSDHRKIIMSIVENKDFSEFENKYNIKIIVEKE